MFDLYHFIIIFISFGAAFFSGLLGIGGGIIVFPSFLFLIPFLGFKSFTVNEISGIAAIQSLSGVFFAYLSHRKFGDINLKLVKIVLPVGLVGALIGSVSAKFFSEKVLLIIYLFLLVMAMTLTLLPKVESENQKVTYKPEKPLFINFIIFVATAVSGALGFAGAVSFIPILNHFFKIPIKIAISATTLIVLITTTLVVAGKVFVGLVPFDIIPSIIIGAIFGANLGSKVNRHLQPSVLRTILILVILTLGMRILFTVFEY